MKFLKTYPIYIQEVLMSEAQRTWNADGDLGPHSVGVGFVAGRFAEVLGLDANEWTWLGLVHDTGKLELPAGILDVPGKLSDKARKTMEMHTTYGHDRLMKNHCLAQSRRTGGLLRIALETTKSHHEHVDGNGYPDRLRGKDIPMSARIMAIADVYDALRSKRVYKPELHHKAVMEKMLETPGQFDLELMEEFTRAVAPKLPGANAVQKDAAETLYDFELPAE